MRVAINHPYFFPYAGYYRLMAASDVFVAFDCVQFPRRGYVHRNKLPDYDGDLSWFSLALKKQARDIFIRDIQFDEDIHKHVKKMLRKFPVFSDKGVLEHDLVKQLQLLSASVRPCDYLIDTLSQMNSLLGFDCKIMRSSEFQLDDNLKGQDRVLAILKKLEADTYINASGGKDLYSNEQFSSEGITLKVLKPYPSSNIEQKSSMLYRVLTEDADSLRGEIESQLKWY